MDRHMCELMNVFPCMMRFSMECFAREFVVIMLRTHAMFCGCCVTWVMCLTLEI